MKGYTYQKCDSCGKRKKRPVVPWTPEQFVCGPCLMGIALS